MLELFGTKVKVNPRGKYTFVPGLCLQSFEGHTSLTQFGKTGMAQTMTLDTGGICLISVVFADGIQSRYTQWLALVLAFHD